MAAGYDRVMLQKRDSAITAFFMSLFNEKNEYLFDIAFDFSLGISLFYRFSLIVQLFAFAKAQLNLSNIFFIEKKPEGYQGIAFLF